MYESLVGRLDLFVRPSAATHYYNLKYTYGDVTLFHSYQLSLALRPTFPFNLKIMNRVGEMHLYIYIYICIRTTTRRVSKRNGFNFPVLTNHFTPRTRTLMFCDMYTFLVSITTMNHNVQVNIPLTMNHLTRTLPLCSVTRIRIDTTRLFP